MRRRKVRRCRSCGAILNGTRLLICESCQAAGMGREIRAEIDAEELLEVAIQREKMELAAYREAYPPLYTIVYANETVVIDVLILSGETTFYYDGYAYNALRGGADLFYFESLFAE